MWTSGLLLQISGHFLLKDLQILLTDIDMNKYAAFHGLVYKLCNFYFGDVLLFLLNHFLLEVKWINLHCGSESFSQGHKKERLLWAILMPGYSLSYLVAILKKNHKWIKYFINCYGNFSLPPCEWFCWPCNTVLASCNLMSYECYFLTIAHIFHISHKPIIYHTHTCVSNYF